MQLALICRYAAAVAVQARGGIAVCKPALYPCMETAGGAVYAKSEELHKFAGLWLGCRSPVSFLGLRRDPPPASVLERKLPERPAFAAYCAGRIQCGGYSI